jgi:toxin ParE1/3/4
MEGLKVHRLVQREVREAFSWYLARDVGAAAKLVDEIWNAFDRVARNPTRWPFEDESQAHRYCVLQTYPCRVIFRIEFDRIHVVALAHAKRRPGYWKRRK